MASIPFDPYALIGEDDLAAEPFGGDMMAPPVMEALPQAKPVDYRIRWDKERRDELARYLCHTIEEYHNAVRQRLDNVEDWRDAIEMYPVASSRGEGMSDLCAPVTRYTTDSHWQRLDSQILDPDQPVAGIPEDQEAIDAVPIIEELMAHKMERAEWQVEGSLLHKESVSTGNALIRVTYEHEVKRVPYEEVETDDEAFDALTAAGMTEFDAHWAALKKDRGQRPIKKLRFKNETVYRGVRLKAIPWEDAILLPATVRDPLQARGIGERVTISGMDLMAGAKAGIYIQEEVDGLLGFLGDDIPDDRQERLEHQGVNPEEGSALGRLDAKYRDYVCYEFCWRWDANDDGQEELLWVLLHEETRRILRLQYSPYEHGKPHYIWAGYIQRTGEPFATCPAETVAGIQAGMTAIINQLIDHGELSTAMSGTLVIGKSSMIDPDKHVWKMNRPLVLNDPNGFKQLQVPPIPTEHYNLVSTMKEWADLVSATSNPTLGKETSGDKTAYEVGVVQSSANAIYEETGVRYAARVWSQVFEQWLALEAQYAEDGVVTYPKRAGSGQLITQEDGTQVPAAMQDGELIPASGGVTWVDVPAEVLRAKVKLIPAGLRQMADLNTRMQIAGMAKEELKTNPLTAGNAEVQKLALKEYLHAIKYSVERQVMDATERGLAAQQAVAAAGMGQQVAAEEAAAEQAAMEQGAVPPEMAPAGPESAPNVAVDSQQQMQQPVGM